MVWIQDWRERNGYSREELSRALNRLGRKLRPAHPVTCSPQLILKLEETGAITHPAIADLIAKGLGATPGQRDSIVAKQHRGAWKKATPAQLGPYVPPMPRARARPCGSQPLPVCMIDRAGNVMRHWESVRKAAEAMQLSERSVYKRARGKTSPDRDLINDAFTFRYADAAGNPAPAASRTRYSRINPRQVVMLDRMGREVGRYPDAVKAAADNDSAKSVVYTRCRRMIASNEFVHFKGYTFRWADEWDAMDADARRQDMRRTL